MLKVKLREAAHPPLQHQLKDGPYAWIKPFMGKVWYSAVRSLRDSPAHIVYAPLISILLDHITAKSLFRTYYLIRIRKRTNYSHSTHM